MTPTTIEQEPHWFRAYGDVQLRSYSIDEFGDAYFFGLARPRVSISIHKYEVIRHTPQGAWVRYGGPYGDDPRWVSRTGLRSPVKPTKEEAVEHLLHRQKKYLGILQRKVREVETLLEHFEIAKEKALNEQQPNTVRW